MALRSPTPLGVHSGPGGKPTRHTAYTTQGISLTSAQTTTNTDITIRDGYHFACRKITWRKTAAFSFNVKALRDSIFNEEIDVRALTNGDANGLPYLLDDGIVFPAGTPLQIPLTELSGAANTVEIVFHGEEWAVDAADVV